MTENSSTFFRTITPTIPKDEEISTLAAKMNTALTNAESARLFVSGLTPEVHELLKSSIQEKEFETSMQAAIRGMVERCPDI